MDTYTDTKSLERIVRVYTRNDWEQNLFYRGKKKDS